MKLKYIILSATFFIASISVFSQTNKGTWHFSGKTGMEMSFSKSQFFYEGEKINNGQNDINLTNFKIAPSVGYFIVDNLSLGLSSSLEIAKAKSEDTSTAFMILPTAQYFIPINSPLRPFVQLGVGYGFTPTPNTGWSQAGGLAWGGAAGLAYFINDNFSVDLTGQFLRFTPKAGSGSMIIENSNFDLLLGFSFYF